MEVKLISHTNDPIEVMWIAARTCYNSKGPIQMHDELGYKYSQIAVENKETRDTLDEINKLKDKHWNLVKKVLDSGHQSIAEHVYFTFAIEGISRACSHQLTRHRCGIVFSQQSQRYVEIKENKDELQALLVHSVSNKEQLIEIANKYFVDVNEDNYIAYLECLRNYLTHTANGVKAEDARNLLPNATKTNITMSINLRELIHICNLRLCTRAQLEIRNLFKLIKEQVETTMGPDGVKLSSYLVPTCEIHGYCFEDKCCGRKPTFKSIEEGKKNV